MGLKVYIEEKLEKRFRKLAMEIYGYGKGSLSLAVEDAIRRWLLEHESILQKVDVPEDPVGSMRGLLKHVKKSGVELEHDARDIRSEKCVPHVFLDADIFLELQLDQQRAGQCGLFLRKIQRGQTKGCHLGLPRRHNHLNNGEIW